MIKKIFIALGIVILLLVLGIIIFLLTFDLNHYRNFVMTQASNALGRPVEIRSMSTKLSLVPTVKVEGLRILDNEQKEPVLSIPRLEAIVELTPLLRGQIVVQKIAVPSANFVWAVESKASTEKQDKVATPAGEEKNTTKPSSSKNENDSKIWIDSVTIDMLQCKIGKEKPYEFNVNKFSLKQLSKFSFDIVYLKKTFNVKGNFGSILELAKKKGNLPVDLTISQEGASLKINGKIADVSNLQKMNFQINGNIPNLANFLKKWDIVNDKIPGTTMTLKTSFDGDLNKATIGKTTLAFGKTDFVFTTQGTLSQLTKDLTAELSGDLVIKEGTVNKLWGIKPLELTAKISATKKSVTFSEIQLDAGKSDARGKIQVSFDKKPLLIQGNLDSTYFDIYDLLDSSKKVPAKEEKKSPSQKYILSTEKLPFDLLNKMDADVKLNVAHLRFSKEITGYATINTVIKLQKGILNMPAQVALFGGTIQNQINIQSEKRSLTLETKASGIQLNKIKDLNKNIRNTSAYLTLSIKSVGESLHDLAGNAQGQITAELTEGQIVNKWFNSLPATLNLLKGRGNTLAFSTQDQKTELICGALNLPIKNGIATSDNQIALETDTLSFIVNGQINLKDETMNLKMIPSVNQTRGMANELLEATQAISLTGSWRNIETKVDPIAMAGNLVQAAAKKFMGQQQEKKDVSSEMLCQKALGRSLTHTTKTPKKVQQKTEQKTVNTQQKEQPNLKQQLIQSLSQALTDQVAPEKK